MYFRHDSPRPFQESMIQDIYSALSQKKHIMIHAPTGMGKTDGSLSPAITFAIENDLSVFFLTPKISQHRIAVSVVKDISDKYGIDVGVADIVGKSQCCIHPEVEDLEGDSFTYACSKKIKKRKCDFFLNSINLKPSNVYFHTDAIEFGKINKVCPYELLMNNAKNARVIVADYHHLFLSSIRENFLLKSGKVLEESIIIVDEAHNLAARIRDSLSKKISSFTLKRVARESEMLNLSSIDLESAFNEWAQEVLGKKEETLVEREEFSLFIESFGIPYKDIIENLISLGESYIELTNKKSFSLSFASFLENWEMEGDSVRMLKKEGDRYVLEKRLLDPSIAGFVLNRAWSSVLMSATLLPLEMHRDVLGLPEDTILKQYKSPFKKENILHIISSQHTTKYERRTDKEFRKLGYTITEIIKETPGKVLVFFPSYAVLSQVSKYINTEFVIQERGMKSKRTTALLEKFESTKILCGVQGGSLSEGVDYSDVKTVVIVGVALEEMSLFVKSMIDHYEKKFGKGWEYAYIYPAILKAMQAAGRGRRKEKDRVAVVYLDERFKWKRYSWAIPSGEPKIITDMPEKEVALFHAVNRKI